MDPDALARSAVRGTLSLLALLLAAVAGLDPAGAQPISRSEEREPCLHHRPERQPLFGDLHVHTSLSFDSYTSSQRNDPDAAYRFARGEAIRLPDLDGEPRVGLRLRRPLDFASVTDHAEFLGEMHVCTASSAASPAWWMPLCFMTRSDVFIVQLLAANSWAKRVAEDANPKTRAAVCRWFPERCARGLASFWGEIQAAAERHYDRGPSCRFTTFVGYEYTDTPGLRNLHRNVIFRNEHVPDAPISSYDTGARNFTELWRLLRERCLERGDGCDVLSIPHNPNLAGGLMFPDPVSEQEALDRAFFEPVVEMIQHKAASECRFDRLAGRGVDTADELCTFEQNRTDNLASLGVLFGEMQTEEGRPVPVDSFARRNMIRNVLKDGLALGQRTGRNPFKPGFIGSTDTHSAIPGATDEGDYVGHLGRRDAGYRNVQDHFEDNPGGLAVVWAEENSRDAIFQALRRKEAYATSGTRAVVRVFAGFDLERGLCASEHLVQEGYARGVPMGGDLEPPAGETRPLRVLVSALKDPGSPGQPGTDLERVQIVKGWVDARGGTHERVFDVASAGGPAAGVDPETCAPVGDGAAELCAVWRDPDYEPGQAAFYYARVLENPTCRWSTRQCMAAGVNPFSPGCAVQAAAATEASGGRGDVYGVCCQAEAEAPFYSPIVRERAWTSPIWVRPPG